MSRGFEAMVTVAVTVTVTVTTRKLRISMKV